MRVKEGKIHGGRRVAIPRQPVDAPARRIPETRTIFDLVVDAEDLLRGDGAEDDNLLFLGPGVGPRVRDEAGLLLPAERGSDIDTDGFGVPGQGDLVEVATGAHAACGIPGGRDERRGSAPLHPVQQTGGHVGATGLDSVPKDQLRSLRRAGEKPQPFADDAGYHIGAIVRVKEGKIHGGRRVAILVLAELLLAGPLALRIVPPLSLGRRLSVRFLLARRIVPSN